jgi:Uncharacterized protein conserved in bacteria (DUF2252)
MREFASMRTMDIWYARLEMQDILDRWGGVAGKKRVKKGRRSVEKARTKDSLKAFAKLTEVVDGRRRIVSDPPLLVPIDELVGPDRYENLDDALRNVLRSYRRSLWRDRRKLLERFDYHHAARKVVGVGSVGARAWIVLLTGHDEDDPLFLQAKEVQASVLEPFLGKSKFANHGQRVVEGQRITQAASDLLLGWDRVAGIDGIQRDFYVRQLWDAKRSADVETMDPKGSRSTRRSAAGRLPSRTRAPETPSRSPRTSGRPTRSIARSPHSPSFTPTRTSATSQHYRTPSRTGA